MPETSRNDDDPTTPMTTRSIPATALPRQEVTAAVVARALDAPVAFTEDERSRLRALHDFILELPTSLGQALDTPIGMSALLRQGAACVGEEMDILERAADRPAT